MDVVFFTSASHLRQWFEANNQQSTELYIGFYKKATGRGGVSYAEALDEALCAGWIDGIRRTLDTVSYTIRFTPRQVGSIWSAVNIKRVEELHELGMLLPAGLEIFEARDPHKAKQYSYEQTRELDPGVLITLQANSEAWNFFQAQAPSYQKSASWWVMNAKQETTRDKRLATLIAESAAGRRLANLVYQKKQL